MNNFLNINRECYKTNKCNKIYENLDTFYDYRLPAYLSSISEIQLPASSKYNINNYYF